MLGRARFPLLLLDSLLACLYVYFNRPSEHILSSPQYIFGGYRIQNRKPYGIELALLASIVLAGSSIPRAIKTGKPLPAGLSVLAATGLLIYGRGFLAKA